MIVATLLAALSALSALSALQSADADRLTLSEVFDDVPVDPASLFVYVLLAVSIGAVIRFGRSRGGRPPGAAA